MLHLGCPNNVSRHSRGKTEWRPWEFLSKYAWPKEEASNAAVRALWNRVTDPLGHKGNIVLGDAIFCKESTKGWRGLEISLQEWKALHLTSPFYVHQVCTRTRKCFLDTNSMTQGIEWASTSNSQDSRSDPCVSYVVGKGSIRIEDEIILLQTIGISERQRKHKKENKIKF